MCSPNQDHLVTREGPRKAKCQPAPDILDQNLHFKQAPQVISGDKTIWGALLYCKAILPFSHSASLHSFIQYLFFVHLPHCAECWEICSEWHEHSSCPHGLPVEHSGFSALGAHHNQRWHLTKSRCLNPIPDPPTSLYSQKRKLKP